MSEFVMALRASWRCWNDGEPLDFRGRFYRHDLMTPAFTPGRPGPVSHACCSLRSDRG